MSTREIRQTLFAQFAVVADALAHSSRLALLELLAQGERDVETLSGLLGLSVASTSQHLQRLKHAGLVSVQRHGRRHIYRLASDEVSALVLNIGRVAEASLASVEKIVNQQLRAQDELPPVSTDELARLSARRAVVIVDVRPAEEYAAAHLPGAVNIPLDALRREMSRLPQDREIIVYCRGPYCLLALDAMRMLRRHHYRVRRLEESVSEWRRAGLPVEHGITAAVTGSA